MCVLNPHPAEQVELNIADGFQVDEHQQCYQKILSLRATSEALDRQLTELLEMLSEARKEVLNVPMTNFPPSHGKFQFRTAQNGY